jgi:hypothetical protein
MGEHAVSFNKLMFCLYCGAMVDHAIANQILSQKEPKAI